MEIDFLIAALITLFSVFTVVLPIVKQKRDAAKKSFEEKYMLYKLWAVRGYYPALENISYKEILEEYDFETAYNRIGSNLL